MKLKKIDRIPELFGKSKYFVTQFILSEMECAEITDFGDKSHKQVYDSFKNCFQTYPKLRSKVAFRSQNKRLYLIRKDKVDEQKEEKLVIE